MRFWKPWLRAVRASSGAGDDPAADAVLTLSSPLESADPADACLSTVPPFLCAEVDSGVCVPVALSERNAHLVMDLTHRLREYREREKSVVSPVYNFGGESVAAGGSWYSPRRQRA